VRALAMLAVPTAFSLAAKLFPRPWRSIGEGIATVLYLLLFVLLFHAALRVPGKRAYWDRVAGTIVRYRTAR
jgi:hypothetical protein